MACEDLPQELTICYQGEDVRVLRECDQGQAFYLVYMSDEEGHLRVHMEIDSEGNQTWLEGDISTERAIKIGHLLMATK